MGEITLKNEGNVGSHGCYHIEKPHGWKPKIGGKPQMDGENNGKPY